MTFSENSSKESTTSSPRFFWTSDEPAQFECAIQGVTSFEDCGSGTSGTWTGKNVPDGRQTFLVRARDLYGNRNRNPARFPFEIGMFFMFILLHSNPLPLWLLNGWALRICRLCIHRFLPSAFPGGRKRCSRKNRKTFTRLSYIHICSDGLYTWL